MAGKGMASIFKVIDTVLCSVVFFFLTFGRRFVEFKKNTLMEWYLFLYTD